VNRKIELYARQRGQRLPKELVELLKKFPLAQKKE
jgi:hypothetical protein